MAVIASRPIADPQPGFFRLRAAKSAPWSAAIIYRPCPLEMPADGLWQWLDRWPKLVAEINGAEVEIDKVWTYAERISQAEYNFLRADLEWCRRHAQHLPEANPSRSVDISRIAPVF